MPTDEAGLLTNVLNEGIQLDFCSSNKELIDNSLSAITSNIIISIKSIETTEKNNKKYIFKFKDNGYGMTKKDIKNFITLCKKNTNTGAHGYYGLGAKAAFSFMCGQYNSSYTKILTFNKLDKKKEVIINWDYINTHLDNEQIWTEQVNYENMDEEHIELWNRNYDNHETGTLIIQDLELVLNAEMMKTIKKLIYEIKKTYYYNFINENINIELKLPEELSSKLESLDINFENINKDNSIDSIHYNEIITKNHSYPPINFETLHIKNRLTFSLFAEFKIYHKEGDFKIIVVNTNYENIIDKIFYFYNKLNIYKQNGYKSIELLEDKFSEYVDDYFNDAEEFIYKFTWIDSETLKKDTEIQKQYLGSTSASLNAGLYFIRNNRILSKPIPLDKCRTNQDRTKWRGSMIFNNNMSHLLTLGVNKSIIKEENINKSLYKMLSLLTQKIVNPCVEFMKKKCNHCKKLECECCEECYYSPRDCKCCPICELYIEDGCECCLKCEQLIENCNCCDKCLEQKINCICCSICKEYTEGTCKCCPICELYIEDGCDCCLKCEKLIENCNCCDKCLETKINCICCSICKEYTEGNCNCCQDCNMISCECIICENCKEKKHKCTTYCKEVNGNWQTIKKNEIYIDGEVEKFGAVYLIQPKEHWNTNIYKIGKTDQTINKSNQINRFSLNCQQDYGDFIKIIYFINVNNNTKVEKQIIKKFKEEFQLYRNKKEYFMGDIKKMKLYFLEIISDNL